MSRGNSRSAIFRKGENAKGLRALYANYYGKKEGNGDVVKADLKSIDNAKMRGMSEGSNIIGTGIGLLQQAAKKQASLLKDFQDNDQIPEVQLPTFLKLNIGGTPYRLSLFNLVKRGKIGLMYKFFSSTHEKRLQLCQGYVEETDEYYFERPACYFNPIYAFYTTGIRGRPGRTHMNSFFEELSFWGLTKVFFPELNATAEIDKVRDEDFKKIRFGKVRRKIWNLFEVPESSKPAKTVAIISILAVVLSNLGLILGSMDQFKYTQNVTVTDKYNNTKQIVFETPHPILEYLELVCIIYFTIEYLGKMLAACNRKKIFLEPMNIIDLMAILPFYLELLLLVCGFDLTHMQDFQEALLVMRILRISRVIRLLKLGKHSTGLKLVGKVIESSLFQFGMVAVSTLISLVFFATLIYFVEKDQPKTTFTNIPESFWWAIITMTTVGYGDMYPETGVGKLIATVTIAVGVLVCALPITVMVDNFVHVQKEFEVEQSIKREARKLQFQNDATMRDRIRRSSCKPKISLDKH